MFGYAVFQTDRVDGNRLRTKIVVVISDGREPEITYTSTTSKRIAVLEFLEEIHPTIFSVCEIIPSGPRSLKETIVYFERKD
jgi:hypothetical protein